MSRRRKTIAQLKTEERRRWWANITRDLVLFALGCLIILYEVVRPDGPRSEILLLAGGMVGSPLVLRADTFRRRMNGENGV